MFEIQKRYSKQIKDVNNSNDEYNFADRSPSTSMITSNFDAYYGGKHHSNSHTYYWPWGIWGHYNNIPTEALCAFKCYLNSVQSCTYYFYGNGYCQVGHYNYDGYRIAGGWNDNTKYMVRKDFSKCSLN